MNLFIDALNLVFIFGIASFVWKKEDQAIRPLFWPALGVKILAGIGLGLIYRDYYSTGDTFYLFDLAKERAQLFHKDSGAYFDFLWHDADEEWKGAARSVFFVKIVSLISILTSNNYWITSIWISLLSFLGSLYLVNTIIQFFPKARLSASIAFFFFPSVVFWGSGLIKESIALPALLVISGIFLKAMMNKTPRLVEWGGGLFGFWIVWNLKYYWIAVMLPVMITSLVVHYSTLKTKISAPAKFLYWSVLFLLLCLGVSLSHPNFYLERFLQVVVENDQAFVLASDPSDLIHYESLRANWASVAANSPWALVSGLFRPFLWEANTDLKVAASLENLIILLLAIGSLVRIRGFFQTQNRLIVLSMLVYVVLLCTFLALSTPNLGSLARYKVGFLPFLVFLICCNNPIIDFMLSRTPLRVLKKWFD